MPAIAPFASYAQFSKGEVEIIKNDEEIAEWDFKIVNQLSDGDATSIHECHRFG